ncbi:hypothetical protein G9455_11575 [Aeromonas hydrophila]|uniref:bacteriophage abortive infection AbiH family protein n=1 Tax=Aeromonas hydrophila TaxID=644 RepID=UPI000744BD86|nr:bacteriophage abortive infection AbiH family protein [Aeromonas hydrophila]ALZ80102.1 hypothetical protein AhyD4_11070 [Aeromonas hydrophila]MCA4697988.1 bacteriophage abortive infection AbiH family protein [Aeromonas hydrophila]OLO02298.1 hypothetical protein BS650_02675 [Aeromonas hydrophila]OSO88624.1 hypothetical protein B7E00_15940 [Aeromonas hydrophila]QIO18444.1 hypothetical protein G9455_11575 [Aeromonas hydrophila]
MNTLYVIGNGFDLWHGLPTSYRQFYEFAKDTLDELVEHYSFDPDVDVPWNDFENALGTFDADGFFDLHNEIDAQAEDFRPSFVYGLEDELAQETERHVAIIRDAFIDWVYQIDESQATKKMQFNDNAIFINFNYTSTLQVVYGIEDKNILHIHGCANKHNDLIFGHGKNIVSIPEVDENGDSNRTMFSDAESAAAYPLHAFKKPVDEILEKRNDYFNSLNDVTTIVVIGHSLNEIDLPYFRRIFDSAKDALWKVSYYSENEKESHIKALMSCGVSQENLVLCLYEEL